MLPQRRPKAFQRGILAKHPARETAAKIRLPRTVLPWWRVPRIPDRADANVAF